MLVRRTVRTSTASTGAHNWNPWFETGVISPASREPRDMVPFSLEHNSPSPTESDTFPGVKINSGLSPIAHGMTWWAVANAVIPCQSSTCAA